MFLTVLLVILLIITILLVCPITANVFYNNNSKSVIANYLFFHYTVYPLKEKTENDEKSKPVKKVKKKDDKNQKDLEKDDVKTTIKLVFGTLHSIIESFAFLVKTIKIKKLHLKLDVATGDAAETAIEYGKMSAYVFGGFAAVSNAIKIIKPSIYIKPDFDGSEYKIDFQCKIYIYPWAVLAAGIKILFAMLIRMIKNNMNKDNTVAKTEDVDKQKQKEFVNVK